MIIANAKRQSGFEEFYSRFYWQVYSYLCKHSMRAEDAKDLTHDIFMYCWNKWDSYDSTRSSLGTWLFMIVKCRFTNYIRSRRENVDIDALSEILPDENASDMDRAVSLEMLRENLALALGQISEQARKIIILRYFNNASWEKVAMELGISSGNARVILSRTLKKLAEVMNVENLR